jgi:signal transduction histidine kinase
MKASKRPKIGIKLPALGLVLQLFAIVLLPLTLLLLVIAFGSLSIHQQAMRNMVGDRDARAARTASGTLNAQVNNRVKEVHSMAALVDANPSHPITTSLAKMSYLMPDFDAGVAIFNRQGELISSQDEPKSLSTWSVENSNWPQIYTSLASQPGILLVSHPPGNTAPIGLISTRLANNDLIVGAFSINKLVESALGDILPPDGQLSVMLVGADGEILYNTGGFSDQTADHPGVSEALQGKSGTVYVTVGGDEHVTAYSPVASTGWALITEESWQSVSTPTLRTSQIAPLVLVPVVFIMLLALWFGASQVVRPLRALESKTATLASGDFKTIQQPVGGIAEIQHLQKELVQMADKVDEAQRSLHGYIGAITEAQEDERRRLARELHDDTLQALIALKQRVQLAQLELQAVSGEPPPESGELNEILILTEQTIENLRRLTRAMRPVYLEDLGLVPALEMLVRETSDGMGMSMEFHHAGVEIRLPASTELALYRMTQEACSNITRHAHAERASLSVEFSSNTVTLKVEDDGVGFNLPDNPAEYAAKGHFGLLGLKERAELIGASLSMISSPGKGTSLTVTLPVQPLI